MGIIVRHACPTPRGPTALRRAIAVVSIIPLVVSACARTSPETPAPTGPVVAPRPAKRGPVTDSGGRPSPRPPLPTSFEQLRDEALTLATALRGKYPDLPEVIDLEAMMHDRFGNLAAAATLWEGWLETHPESPEAHLRLGKYAKERGEETAAAEHFQKAFDARPELSGVQVLLGETLTSLGRADAAEGVLARELPATVSNPNRLTLLGHARMQQGDYSAAKADFERALAIDPTSPHALYGLSTACGRLGDNEAAKRYRGQFAARKAESLSRDRATAAARLDDMPSLLLALAGWYAIAGGIERAGGDSSAAERSWLRALDAAPNQRDAAAGLLDLYRRQGREDEARSLVERRSATVAIPAGGKN